MNCDQLIMKNLSLTKKVVTCLTFSMLIKTKVETL